MVPAEECCISSAGNRERTYYRGTLKCGRVNTLDHGQVYRVIHVEVFTTQVAVSWQLP